MTIKAPPEAVAYLGSQGSEGSGGPATTGDHGAETELRRMLGTRHLTMVALGSSIGTGLWLGTGTSLRNGGPVAIFIGYCLAGSVVWCVSHSIGELSILYPLPAAYTQWTGKFVDKSAAFALGWSSWFGYCITIASELSATNTILTFWTQAVPVAGWITIFWAAMVLVNVGAVRVFGEIEVVSSSVKFGWIFVVIGSMTAMSAGGVSGYGPVGFRYWAEAPFTHGLEGFLAVLPSCVFAMSGSENLGLVACETADPRRSVPRAVRSTWARLAFFYLLGSTMATINVPPDHPDLFGASSGPGASPFVIAYRDAGLWPLAHLMNAVILLSVVSTGTVSTYGGPRMLMGLSWLGMAPRRLRRADAAGRPWWGLAPTALLGGGLAYLNVSAPGAEVFTWLSRLVSLITLFTWAMICLSHIRLRRAWERQGRAPADLPWRSWIFPYGAWWGLLVCAALLVVELYLAVSPLAAPPSASHFFANYVSVVLIVVIYLGARLYHRGPWWVRLDEIDLDEGRRFYADQGDAERVVAAAGRWDKLARGARAIVS